MKYIISGFAVVAAMLFTTAPYAQVKAGNPFTPAQRFAAGSYDNLKAANARVGYREVLVIVVQ